MISLIKNKSLFIMMTFLIVLSCSKEKPTEMTKQSSVDVAQSPYSLQISPAEASRNTTLSLIAKGFDISKAQIEWLANGEPTAIHTVQFNSEQLRKGDTVQVKAAILGKEILSNVITIKNAPPSIGKIRFMPDVLKQGDTLYVDVEGEDIDGDSVSILYEWEKNGEPAGNERAIGASIKRGDKVSVKITPFDGEDYGKTAEMEREIANFPPVIIEDKNFTFDGIHFIYQVKAADPDEDNLIYSLMSAPADMTINPDTGLVKWDVPRDFLGKTEITAVVSDDHGGKATYTLNFETAKK